MTNMICEQQAEARRKAAESTIEVWKDSIRSHKVPSEEDSKAWNAFMRDYPIQAAGVKNSLSAEIGWEKFIELVNRIT